MDKKVQHDQQMRSPSVGALSRCWSPGEHGGRFATAQ
jgi:hypothetical protein